MSDPQSDSDWILEVRQWLQNRDNSHAAAVSAADNAELRAELDESESLCVAKQSEIDALRKLHHGQVERIKVLEDALRGIAYYRAPGRTSKMIEALESMAIAALKKP